MEESRKEIKELRDFRNKQRERANYISLELEACLNKFAVDTGDHFIPLKDFANLRIGKKYNVVDGVSFTPISYTDNKWEFITDVDAGCFFGIHSHDVVELCEVIEGELVDQYSGKHYHEGEVARFEKETKHKPGATIPSRYLVTFLINEDEK